MLSVHDRQVAAYAHVDDLLCMYCPDCAPEKAGGQTIEMARVGRYASGWEPQVMYQVHEDAVELGYELGQDCDSSEHTHHDRDGERWCEECAALFCQACGKRLDVYQDEKDVVW